MKVLWPLGLMILLSVPSISWGAEANYNDAKYCSRHFAMHGDVSLPADAQRKCVIAIASTYVNGEENTAPMEDMLLADDISRHRLGTPADHQAGAADRIKSGGPSVILAIKNRHWTADGNQAWIAYDGYLKGKPDAPSFYVAERFTIESGLIKEILLAPVVMVEQDQ